MTKEEAKAYIERNGNARLVIDTLKAMKAEGIEITEAELDRRMKQETTRGMISIPDTPSYYTPQAEIPLSANTAGYEQNMNTMQGGGGNSLTVLMIALFVIGSIIYGIGTYMMRKQALMDPYTVPKMSILMIAGLIIITLIQLMALWRMFEKADRPGWMSIVPIMNIFIMFDIIFGRATAALRLFIPFYNFYWAIKSMLELANRYGKGTGFGVGLIFLPSIFQIILGFDDSVYSPPL